MSDVRGARSGQAYLYGEMRKNEIGVVTSKTRDILGECESRLSFSVWHKASLVFYNMEDGGGRSGLMTMVARSVKNALADSPRRS